jgi:hypothetical protein
MKTKNKNESLTYCWVGRVFYLPNKAPHLIFVFHTFLVKHFPWRCHCFDFFAQVFWCVELGFRFFYGGLKKWKNKNQIEISNRAQHTHTG